MSRNDSGHNLPRIPSGPFLPAPLPNNQTRFAHYDSDFHPTIPFIYPETSRGSLI